MQKNTKTTQGSRITRLVRTISPRVLKARVPLTDAAKEVVEKGRSEIDAVFNGDNRRMVLVFGPCSFHDVDEVVDYASRIVPLAKRVNDKIVVYIRLCPHKPRSARGWAGIGYDPRMDNSWDTSYGLELTRKAAVTILEMGLPLAMEMLDTNSEPHISDLYSYIWLGARDVLGGDKRRLASGSSMRVGFKNEPNGDITGAVAACTVSQDASAFNGVDDDNYPCMIHTTGNNQTNILLRGGYVGLDNKPNYHEDQVRHAITTLKSQGLCPNLMVDCGHGNSDKSAEKQIEVLRDVVRQRLAGNAHLVAAMFESYLVKGNQKYQAGSPIKPGVSLTDECLGLEDTISLVEEIHRMLPSV